MAASLPVDHFTRPYDDLDDVQARIAASVAFATERTAGKAVPADLASELVYARETLAVLRTFKSARARAREFKAEHGFEILKGLWFAFSDHAALLGLRIA